MFAREFKLDRRFTTEGRSIKDLIANIEKTASGFMDSIHDETGRIRPYVNLFVNGINIRSREDAMNIPLKDGDSVYIIPSVAGG